MKTAISIALRVIALTVILFTCFAVAGGVLGLQGTPPPPGQAGATSVANRSVIGARLPEDQPPGRPVSRLAAGRYNDWGDEVGGSNPLAPTDGA
jgi:hypothetical protein